ncbi:hypothetical protein [Cryobacterium mannosilyticum]|uniref:XRE family transcriptional regulator n=1 Tax=Cryobacterium mannosilyticum TaxID=1259190 RepID=A0A4R8WCE0_9MICO|nr:hypothetical protein [Cryobacterium mannosilyticum]TFC06751.1 hypothetical protein E3O32_03300 [Cryobacterium mannosilyticum]
MTRNEVSNLAKGARYPNPREIDGIVKLFGGLPIEAMFEAEMLKYRDAESWPPKGAGFRPPRAW